MLWDQINSAAKNFDLDKTVKGIQETAKDIGGAAKEIHENYTAERAEEKQRKIDAHNKLRELTKDVVVTTGDLRQDYDIISPIFFQVSNRDLFSSKFTKLTKQYEAELLALERRQSGALSELTMGFIMGEWSVGESDFEKDFYIATEELKRKSLALGTDAVICMKQDIDLDTNGFQYFYLQMYGHL